PSVALYALISLLAIYLFPLYSLFFLVPLPPPRSTLFPYTTLFRSCRANGAATTARPASPPGWREAESAAGRSSGRPTTLGSALRSEEHTSELQSRVDLVCRLLLEKKKKKTQRNARQHENHRCTYSL